MRKGVLLFVFLFVLVLPIIFAAVNETEETKKDKAYACLNEKVNNKCSNLSLEQQIFSLLATGNCKAEVNAASSPNSCWPAANCDVKTTAQAILALSNSGENTDTAEDWLLSQNKTPENINWFLEIESTEATACTISYSGLSNRITIGADKKISSAAGNCLTLAQGNYWLRISPSCLDVEFQVSCDKGFLTTLLFKKTDSSTIHVSKDISESSAGGSTPVKVNSFCFKNTNQCTYEGSLWAALVLSSLERDISFFTPYLTTMSENNARYIPEAFLYLITGYADFRNNLLINQKGNYWEESGDKYYDTALALLALRDQVYQEKTKAKEWLLSSQDSAGCWQGNIRNTAFILYSVWPRSFLQPGQTEPYCEDQGFYCMSSRDCTGQILDNYECTGMLSICCDTALVLETCSEMNGDTCNTNEECAGGADVPAFDTTACCVGGTCEVQNRSTADCEPHGGTCESSGTCDEGFEESFSYSCDFNDACCMPKSSTKVSSSILIWILVILVALVIIGILFKNKLQMLWFRMKSGSGASSSQTSGPGPRFPPMTAPRSYPPIQRRILPPSQPTQIRRPAPKRSGGEMDEVLKKLKEMGS